MRTAPLHVWTAPPKDLLLKARSEANRRVWHKAWPCAHLWPTAYAMLRGRVTRWRAETDDHERFSSGSEIGRPEAELSFQPGAPILAAGSQAKIGAVNRSSTYSPRGRAGRLRAAQATYPRPAFSSALNLMSQLAIFDQCPY